MKTKLAILFTAWAAVAVGQQPFDFKLLDKLAKNAKESTNVSLDANTIKLGASLLGNDGDGDSKQFKEAVKGIKGISVRSYEYEKRGMYNAADLEPVRAYFRSLNWSKIVDVKSDEENSEIYLNTGADGKIGGLAIVTSEPKEVTVVYISGSIGAEQLGALSGKMGIPEMNFSADEKNKDEKNKKDSGKKEEDENR